MEKTRDDFQKQLVMESNINFKNEIDKSRGTLNKVIDEGIKDKQYIEQLEMDVE
jgi:hypothetical protein